MAICLLGIIHLASFPDNSQILSYSWEFFSMAARSNLGVAWEWGYNTNSQGSTVDNVKGKLQISLVHLYIPGPKCLFLYCLHNASSGETKRK